VHFALLRPSGVLLPGIAGRRSRQAQQPLSTRPPLLDPSFAGHAEGGMQEMRAMEFVFTGFCRHYLYIDCLTALHLDLARHNLGLIFWRDSDSGEEI
jgi:hypothetical protein